MADAASGDADAASPAKESLPSTAHENLKVLQRFEDESGTEASRMQLVIERISEFFGSPAYFVGVICFVVLWMAVNGWGSHEGWPWVDKPPFYWLQGLVSFNALILTVTVLIRQSRMAHLASHRAHLDLQINLLTEQKVSKLLQLLEEARPESLVPEPKRDAEARELAKPTDAGAMLQAIKETRGDKPPA